MSLVSFVIIKFMDKQQLLGELRALAAAGQVSKEEVLGALETGMAGNNSTPRSLSISEILYYVGGGIIFMGIAILLGQNWDSLDSFLRIFVTLGSCAAAFIVAALLYRYEQLSKVSQAFFLIFGLLSPLGIGVTFNEAGLDLGSEGVMLGLSAILTAALFAAFWFYRQTILMFFGIVFATWVFHFIVALLVGNSLTYSNEAKVWQYQLLAVGLVYMLLGYHLRQTKQKSLTGVLYGFGCIMFLGSSMALGGWSPNQNIFWELIYPLLVFGIIFLSVYTKSKAFLVFGTLFLIGYILKLTGEFFTEGLGWPLALVLAGLLIMVVGYFAVKINRQYLKPVV